MEFNEIPGKRMGSKIYRDEEGYEYFSIHLRNDIRSLRCIRHNPKIYTRPCPGRAKISDGRLHLVSNHIHATDADRQAVMELRTLILDEAVKYPLENARTLFNRVTRDHPMRNRITFPEVENLIFTRRRKYVPKVPKDLEEFLQSLQANPLYNRYFQRPVYVEGELCGFIFSNGKLMEKLGETDFIQFDGTFFTVPQQFKTKKGGQLFTIFFNIGHHTFPGLSVLMNHRSEKHYDAVNAAAKELIPNFNPSDAIADFECASRSSASNSYPGLVMHSCFFHYTQTVFRYMKNKCGLVGLYNRSPRAPETVNHFKIWVLRIMSIPLLPHHLIRATFESLLEQDVRVPRNSRANLAKFKNYLERQWLNSTTVLPRNLSVFGMDIATTNGGESYHWSSLKKEIKIAHPNIWYFLQHMFNVLDDKAADVERLENDPNALITRPRKREVEERLIHRREQEERLLNGDITPIEFLDNVMTNVKEIIQDRLETLSRDDMANLDENETVEEANDDEENVPPELQCAVCLGPRNEPHILQPCGHMLCNACSEVIVQYPRRHASKVCPNCRLRVLSRQRVYF